MTDLVRQIQNIVVAELRVREVNAALAETLAGWSDAELTRRVFRDASGQRLTQFGLQLLQDCFESFAFPVEAELPPSQLVFLNARAKLPYFCDHARIVLFDVQLAVRLRLVGTSIATLMAIDTID